MLIVIRLSAAIAVFLFIFRLLERTMRERFLTRLSQCLLFFCAGVFGTSVVHAQLPDSHHPTLEYHETLEDAQVACGSFAVAHGAHPWNCSYYGPSSDGPGSEMRFSQWVVGWLWIGSNYDNAVYGTFKACRDFEIYSSDLGRCVPIYEVPPPERGDAAGPACKRQPQCGKPINPGNGNMWHDELDYASAGPLKHNLRLSRMYNSIMSLSGGKKSSSFGERWSFPYDANVEAIRIAPLNKPEGPCWWRSDNHLIMCFERKRYVAPVIPDSVFIARGDGKALRFNRVGSDWSASVDINDRLTSSNNTDGTAVTEYVLQVAANRTTERFDGSGKLLSIQSADGMVQRLTYSSGTTNDSSAGRYPVSAPTCSNIQLGTTVAAGRLLCVTDHHGKQLNFEYDADKRITAMIDPSGERTLYAYSGSTGGGCITGTGPDAGKCINNILTSVTYPDGKTRTYHYNELDRINGGVLCPGAKSAAPGFAHILGALTGITDENGHRHISWTYDCNGRATSSEVGSGAEKVELTYGDQALNMSRTTTVKHTAGTAAAPLTTIRSYSYENFFGLLKNVGVSGECVECGSIKSRTYDSRSNDATTTDWNGIVTQYEYDLTRNLETKRTEAFGTPAARIISTVWHPTLRLPQKIAEPKRIVQYTYDTAGNVLTYKVQGTSDATGALGFNAAIATAARVWTYTYNGIGQKLTEDGPRTDVVDRTNYTYDASTGNLAKVADALGFETKFANYDAHGRARQITAPNGAVTTLDYWPRGWLRSSTVSAGGVSQTTTYDYDDVGQLKVLNTPDGASMTFAYDEAHRMVSAADNRGNSITYELDYLGNRISEQVKDPGGNLARQVTRQFDALNRLQQQTGAAQ